MRNKVLVPSFLALFLVAAPSLAWGEDKDPAYYRLELVGVAASGTGDSKGPGIDGGFETAGQLGQLVLRGGTVGTPGTKDAQPRLELKTMFGPDAPVPMGIHFKADDRLGKIGLILGMAEGGTKPDGKAYHYSGGLQHGTAFSRQAPGNDGTGGMAGFVFDVEVPVNDWLAIKGMLDVGAIHIDDEHNGGFIMAEVDGKAYVGRHVYFTLGAKADAIGITHATDEHGSRNASGLTVQGGAGLVF